MIHLKPRVLAVPLFLLWTGGTLAAQYLNSAEPMCNGSDPTVVMCDDFEDGVWIQTAEAPNNTANDGWWGNPGSGNALSVSGGVAGTSLTATTGFHSGTQGAKSGWHFFGPGTGDPFDGTKYDEIYHRFYLKFLGGYDFGHEKLMAYHHDTNIAGQVAFFHSPDGGQEFIMVGMERENNGVDGRFPQNQGNTLSWVRDHWYYIEVRIKLDTPKGANNGVLQVWADDCGTSGLQCTGPGTLRLSYTGRNDLRRSNSMSLGTIHHEFWLPTSPPEFVGSGTVHLDQVVVRTQRIGPMGATVPPPTIVPPSNLRVR
jgi:hypothetical protein